MRLKRLYSINEFTAKAKEEAGSQKRFILTGEAPDLYEMMYKTLRNFAEDEVSAKYEDNHLIINVNKYLTERVTKFIESNKKDKIQLVNEFEKA